MEPAKKMISEDRGETIDLVEPLLVDEDLRLRTWLTDLAVELVGRAAVLRIGPLHSVLTVLADLVSASLDSLPTIPIHGLTSGMSRLINNRS